MITETIPSDELPDDDTDYRLEVMAWDLLARLADTEPAKWARFTSTSPTTR